MPVPWRPAVVLVAAVTLASCSSSSGRRAGSAAPTTTVAPPPATTSGSSTTPAPPATAAPTTTAPPPVPAGFAARSVTFVSARSGWVLGTSPCATGTCPVLLHTEDGGDTWSPVPGAPPAAPAGGPPDQRRVRFADAEDGWIFGPDLWVTHDAGAHWSQPTLPGVAAGSTVAALEASAGQVHAAVDDAGQPGTVRIFSSAVGRDDWRASATTVPLGAGPVPGTQIVLHGGAGWLVQVDRIVVGGAVLRNGAWVSWRPPCSDAGGGATLAASTTSDLAAVCDEGTWAGPANGTHLYVSTDGGFSFRRVAEAAPVSTGQAATPQPGTVVAMGAGVRQHELSATFDGGRGWTTVFTGRAAGIFVDLGFTTRQRGVAVEIDPQDGGGRLLRSLDGGRTWQPVDLAARS